MHPTICARGTREYEHPACGTRSTEPNEEFSHEVFLRDDRCRASWRCRSRPAHAGTKDIVDTAAGAGKFQTLITAAKAAGLVETLKGDGPFTVFAPTDEAFAKLPKGTVEDLLKPENKASWPPFSPTITSSPVR